MLFSSSLLFSLHFSFSSFVICVIWVVWIFSFCALVWEYFSCYRHQDVLASESQAKIIEGNKILQFSSQKNAEHRMLCYAMGFILSMKCNTFIFAVNNEQCNTFVSGLIYSKYIGKLNFYFTQLFEIDPINNTKNRTNLCWCSMVYNCSLHFTSHVMFMLETKVATLALCCYPSQLFVFSKL